MENKMELTEQITITVIVLLVLLIVALVINFSEAPSNLCKCTEYVEDRCSSSSSPCFSCSSQGCSSSCSSETSKEKSKCKTSENFNPSSKSCDRSSSSSYTASSLSCYPSPSLSKQISSSSDDYSKTYSSSYEESYNSYLRSSSPSCEKQKEEAKENKKEVNGRKKGDEGRRCKIPKRIIQTYRDRDLPIKMYEATETFKTLNKDYKYKFYDNESSRNFIEQNFESSVLRAYDSLIPGAFKADIFRLCELYINGGFYVDVSMVGLHSFSCFDYIDADLILVKDIPSNHIYNAFIGCVPKHPIIKYLLDEVVKNVLHKNMGASYLDVTGPQILGRKFKEYVISFNQNSNNSNTEFDIKLGMLNIGSKEKNNKVLFLEHGNVSFDEKYVVFNLDGVEKNFIKTKYPGWRSDRAPGSHYSDLYKEGKVFK